MSGYLSYVKDETKTLLKRDEAESYTMEAMKNIQKANNEKQYATAKKENLDWLEKNKSNEGVTVLPSGLQYKVIKEGKGAKPVATDSVRVAYKGTTIDGNVFDSQESFVFPLNRVISGWTEGLQLMSIGSKYVFYIPYNLAYGEQGAGEHIPPYSTLIFDVELFEIVK